MWCSQKGRWWSAIAVGLLVGLLSTVAMASGGDVKAQIESLDEQLKILEEAAPEGVGEEDFRAARGWLREAAERHQAGRSSGVEQRIRRVDHTLDLLRAQTATVQIRESIEQQHESYAQAQAQIEQLRDEIQALERQRDERKSDLERVLASD